MMHPDHQSEKLKFTINPKKQAINADAELPDKPNTLSTQVPHKKSKVQSSGIRIKRVRLPPYTAPPYANSLQQPKNSYHFGSDSEENLFSYYFEAHDRSTSVILAEQRAECKSRKMEYTRENEYDPINIDCLREELDIRKSLKWPKQGYSVKHLEESISIEDSGAYFKDRAWVESMFQEQVIECKAISATSNGQALSKVIHARENGSSTSLPVLQNPGMLPGELGYPLEVTPSRQRALRVRIKTMKAKAYLEERQLKF